MKSLFALSFFALFGFGSSPQLQNSQMTDQHTRATTGDEDFTNNTLRLAAAAEIRF